MMLPAVPVVKSYSCKAQIGQKASISTDMLMITASYGNVALSHKRVENSNTQQSSWFPPKQNGGAGKIMHPHGEYSNPTDH
jgi:hypothetical protein